MQKLHILNSKEKKKLISRLDEHFGSSFSTDKILMQDEKGSIFLISQGLANIEFDKLKIDKAGLFFGTFYNDEIILSVEGSQLLAEKGITKNIVEISDKEEIEYLSGETIATDLKDGNYILKHSDDFLGTAKARGGKLLNALPRNRRINQ